MADLIIKPNSATGDKLILQDRAGGAVLTTASSGATLGNSTQDNITRLGTVTSGTLAASGVVFPAGHIIQMNQTISQSHTSRTGNMNAYESTGVSVTLANELQTNSKLYATLSAYTGESTGGHWSTRHIFTIYQNGTNVVGTQVAGLTADKGLTTQGSHSSDNQYFSGSHAAAILFTPTGSATAKKTVELYWRANSTTSFTMHMNSGGHAGAYLDNGATCLNLMEVAQ